MPTATKYQKPFLKWVGGKHSLLPQIMPHVPSFPGRYYEPFLGSGAMFFALAPKQATLTDGNERLTICYRAVQYAVDGVIGELETLERDVSVEAYDILRDCFNRNGTYTDNILQAVYFIYLNKVGYRGMYRENSKGAFNVPYGHYRKPVVCDRKTLLACSRALNGAIVRHGDFRDIAYDRLGKDDFVYFDPPYVPLSPTSNFTGYNSAGFSERDHRDLAEIFKNLPCKALLSNSDTALVRELYGDFEIIEIERVNRINSTGDRTPVGELLMKKT